MHLNHLVNSFEVYKFDTFLHQCDAPSMREGRWISNRVSRNEELKRPTE